ncbi:peptidoglycan DD-metalloendopeptidase family protein [Luteimonas sp. SX5]|uniref:Peptidoglycan DD-metalloendopeptidase family protein n=2 Tax=Luteimonas galliterrae TaxID=2940486 RepID=A0ABT0MM24_9GAMM|nr:peptidoglycan DD-metalloendopeptidase family protein [Luteimonas galliterrae]MCL1635927.1 peptidoglycan DD-metalloendopeptidase family protein [Luteimonas galliterrae]
MPARARLLLLAALLAAGAAPAQSSRETERKLERARSELKSIASERRKLEGQRGAASRELRQADEQVGQSSRTLRETESALARQAAALAELQQRRDVLHGSLNAQREELTRLLRAAYKLGGDAPLKVLLAQDRVADASRDLAYHRYLQRDRAQRVAALTADLRELDDLERDIVQKREQLDDTRENKRKELAALEKQRRERAALIAQLDQRYKDRNAKEKALGRDVKALERLLAQLRAAAARAAKEREAAAERAASRSPSSSGAKRAPVRVAATAPINVGGLGWPASGALLAGYGGTMPDGRRSEGVLIGASAGSPVRAVADGTVVYAEWMTGYGLLLIVDHGNGYMSLYAHNDALLKDAGDAVKRGDALGSVGNSGGQGRPSLYFELRRNGQPVNPDVWLQKR